METPFDRPSSTQGEVPEAPEESGYAVKVTQPDGDVDVYHFDDKDEANEFAQSYFDNMDTSEARETAVSVRRICRRRWSV
jgi:hypothetical protein